MLTRKQRDLLVFIRDRLDKTGVAPSFDEMKDALDLRSKSGIHRLITALEERGFIRRLPHRARALEVLRLPEDARAAARPASPAATPVARFRIAEAERESVALPLYGRIAAGLPIEALSDNSQSVEVPAAMIHGGDHFALEVAGDSMVEAGILDGDTVLIRRVETADDGTIVVALVDDAEVTLKRWRRRGKQIVLEPANSQHEIRVFPADRVRVQGRLVGLLRRYM